MKYSDQIEKFLKTYISDDIFLGCFPKDLIPQQTLYNKDYCILIINLDESIQPGSHYIALVKHNAQLFMYNSMGESYYHNFALEPWLSAFAEKNKLKLWKNKTQHQSSKSNVCGYFCVWFSMMFDLYKPNVKNMCNYLSHMKKIKNSKINQNNIVEDLYTFIEAYVRREQMAKIKELFSFS